MLKVMQLFLLLYNKIDKVYFCLSTYSLGNNQIGASGAQALGGSLQYCTNLQNLQ